MNISKGFDKRMPLYLKWVCKHKGIFTNIYLPKKLDSYYGGKGSEIEYYPTPTYSEKMYIPALDKAKSVGIQGIIDPFLDGDQAILYLPGANILPDYCKVEVPLFASTAKIVYKIDKCIDVKDDQFVFIRKYYLTPITDLFQVHTEELPTEDMVQRELDLEDIVDEPLVRETVNEGVIPIQWTYAPLGELND